MYPCFGRGQIYVVPPIHDHHACINVSVWLALPIMHLQASYETLPMHPSLYASESTNYVSLRLSLATARASIRPCVQRSQLCVRLVSRVTSCACIYPSIERCQICVRLLSRSSILCVHLSIDRTLPIIRRATDPWPPCVHPCICVAGPAHYASNASPEALLMHPSLYASESTYYVSLRLSLIAAHTSIRPCVRVSQSCVTLHSLNNIP